jgi:hypothetical protein
LRLVQYQSTPNATVVALRGPGARVFKRPHDPPHLHPFALLI